MAKLFQETSWVRGEVVTLRFTVSTGEDPTAFAMKFTMKAGYNQPEVFTRITGGGITIDSQKRILVSVPYADSKALGGVVPQEYLFDLWRTDTGTDIQMAQGKIIVKPPVRTLP